MASSLFIKSKFPIVKFLIRATFFRFSQVFGFFNSTSCSIASVIWIMQSFWKQKSDYFQISLEANQPNTDISTNFFFQKSYECFNTNKVFIWKIQSVNSSVSDNHQISQSIRMLFGQSISQYRSHLVQSICKAIRKSISQSSFIHINHKVFSVLTRCFCKHEFWYIILTAVWHFEFWILLECSSL